ncbi:glycosyltransferase [Maribacter confluentis]|uniref:Glycosyltransferase n=1 Tax=Maribacter confluentis TaxID=1656093 RepID=A0ABT8RTS9_9FLAO|nr:glycosyltransferase [Maribacter confluentis]MDO1514314.1 glycosyltransferase [Maribacter confluentis]
MQNIAVLLTCFNRKEKTLKSLEALYTAYNGYEQKFSLSIYLTDDGSTDGTAESVKSKYPEATILLGNGQLYWAGGMRNSWNEALNKDYDIFFLLNDDTIVNTKLFSNLLDTHQEVINKYGIGGIYLGSTMDPHTNKLTYGGAKLLNKFMLKYQHLIPNGNIQECELGNANIMFVSKNVVKQIGILSTDYIHGVADYDYTLRAVKKNLPVVIMPNFCGVCENEHVYLYEGFAKMSFKKRLKHLNNPTGIDSRSNLNLMKNHFPIRVPFFITSSLIKLVFPALYTKFHKSR